MIRFLCYLYKYYHFLFQKFLTMMKNFGILSVCFWYYFCKNWHLVIVKAPAGKPLQAPAVQEQGALRIACVRFT